MPRLAGFINAIGYGARVYSEWHPAKGGNPVRGYALLDSGAERSIINVMAIQPHSWQRESNYINITGVVASGKAPLYAATLILRDDSGAVWKSKELNLGGLSLSDPVSMVAIIGLDILSQADFHMTRQLGRFTLEIG